MGWRWIAPFVFATQILCAVDPYLYCEKRWGELEWQGMTFRRYSLRAEGFPREKLYQLLVKNFDGSHTETFFYRANNRGHLILEPIKEIEDGAYAICPVKRGERLTFIMRSEDKEEHIIADVVPFPIETKSKKGVKVHLELMGNLGEEFLLTAEGFLPGEEIQVSCYYNDSIIGLHPAIDEKGKLRAVITLPEDSEGTATLIVHRNAEEIVLSFDWGAPALKLVGACCLEVK
ncbi:MAG: hypothetical protein V4492_08380 [Chlamydiota bacterium]